MCTQKNDPRFPVIEPEEEAVEQWMSIAEAAEYGDMSTARIYKAIKTGLRARKNPVSNIIEVPREALECFFCPFKRNAQYEDQKVVQQVSRQQIRIHQLRARIDGYRDHIEDLKEIIRILKKCMDVASEENWKLLKIIATFKKD